jgi:hypothetical protein
MNVLAVYDISSSSVAGAHVVRTDAAPVMLASARTNIPLQDDINMSRFVEEGVKHLGQIVEQIKAKDAHHPTHIQVILASPWYVSQTRTIVYKQEKAFTCTSKLVDGLVDREVEAILAEGGSFGSDSVVVEKQISSILLNGYETSTPFGKHATSLELFLSVTVAPKPVLERFTDVLQRHDLLLLHLPADDRSAPGGERDVVLVEQVGDVPRLHVAVVGLERDVGRQLPQLDNQIHPLHF